MVQLPTLSIILGLSSIFIAIILFVTNHIAGLIRDLKIDIQSRVGQLETETKSRMGQLETEIKSLQHQEIPSLPSLELFWLALVRQSKFWGKVFIQAADKGLIASAIASSHVQTGSTIIVDSGTTVDRIPQMLSAGKLDVTIYTNNLLAAISVVPPRQGCDCYLLAGKVDPIYGATYNTAEQIKSTLRQIEANDIILSATSISFEHGPMIDKVDRSNGIFKKELILKAIDAVNDLTIKIKPRLIIAVDWTKFGMQSGDGIDKDWTAVVDQREWLAVRGNNRFLLVVTNPPDDLNAENATRARKEIEKFCENAKKEKMKIEICKIKGDNS